MSKFTFPLACLFLFSFSKMAAQVAAGVSDNLVGGNKNIYMNAFAFNFGDFADKFDSLDFNGDGLHDALFQASAANIFDLSGGGAGVGVLHPNFELMTDSNGYARQLMAGDSIGAGQTWSTSSLPWNLYGSPFAARSWGFSGQLQQYGNWLVVPAGFAGFRVITSQDTLYGWMYVEATANANFPSATLLIGAWAIQHDPTQKPWVSLSKTPQKAVYCHGDYVIFSAKTAGAEQIVWHFWDGTTDTAAVVTKILPDSTVTATFEATNQNGTATFVQTLEVSPLALDAPDITLDCSHPTGALSATTNIPADICWVVASDTSCNPTPPVVNFPVPVTVFAQDDYGCVVAEQVEILLDANLPDVFIEYDEANHRLIAHSSTPGVTFFWVSMSWPVITDTVTVTQSGTYTLVATAPNGCTSSASITVVITATGEPLAEPVLVQPNPASDFLQIENRFSSDLNFKIFDAAGMLHLETSNAPANSILKLGIEFLPAGLYWLAGCDAESKLLFFKKFSKF